MDSNLASREGGQQGQSGEAPVGAPSAAAVASATSAAVPVDGGALTTARDNLRKQYAFVGALERQRESLCVLSAVLGVATPKASGDRLKGPTTHTKGNVPEDFREAFAAYVAQDDQLYAEALELLDAHVEAFPRCKS